MATTIRIYGVVPRADEVSEELKRRFGEDTRIERGSLADDQRKDKSVWMSDLILCGFDPASAAEDDVLINLIGRVVATYGAWSYLPQVVLGMPTHPEAHEELLRLGASCYLPAGTPPARIAEKAHSTWRATWWRTECQREVPVLVVNRQGVIQRANPFADRRFGPAPLVGRSYMEVIEGCPSDSLPEDQDHPVRRVFTNPSSGDQRWGQSLCVERQFKRRRDPKGQPEDEEERFFLMCNPLVIPSGRPQSAAITLFDMSRWSRIIEALNAFAQAKDRDKLYELIVQQAGRLGFERVRLYQLDPADGRLHGREAIGFRSTDRKEHFVTAFSFAAEEDPSTPITLQKKNLCLFIHGEGRHTEFSQYMPGSHAHPEDLEWDGVMRWIEAAIFLPPSAEGAERRAWGKLSLDRGQHSAHLDVRDLGDVAVFCSIVGLALEGLRRLEQEGQQRRRLRKLSADLVAAIKPDEEILVPSVQRCLELILEVTGGDLALYRRFDKQMPQALRLVEVSFKDEALQRRMRRGIPRELPESRALSPYFRHFLDKGDPGWTDKAYIVADPASEMVKFEQERPGTLTDEQREYVRFIRSEMHVPVFRGDAPVGVIVVISGRPNAFPPEAKSLVGQFVHAISLGIESARRHDDWLLMGKALQRAFKLLPKLADVPLGRDDAFFAALAVLLSAEQGLRWNRVFVFSCHANTSPPTPPPKTADLVYALGGLTKKDAAAHRGLQQKVRDDPRYADLSKLVDERVQCPEPHWQSPTERMSDRLYDRCIDEPRKDGKPIRVDYAEPVVVGEPPSPDAKEVEETNPVGALLRIGLTELPARFDPLTIPVNSRLPNQWVLDMNRQYPGMFDESKKLFAFLLRGATGHVRGPLGVVMVDMQSPYEVDEMDMVAATRFLLRLASDLLAERYRRRLYHGNINSLPVRSHGPTLSKQWAMISQPLLDAMPTSVGSLAGHAAAVQPAEVARHLLDRLTAIVEKFKTDPKWAASYVDQFMKFHERMKRLEGGNLASIDDLGATLREWRDYYGAKNYAEVGIALAWEPEVEGLQVPCDPLVLQHAFGAFLDNSREEARRLQRLWNDPQLRLNVHLEAKVVETSCPAMPRVVQLIYTDDGGGIHKGHWRNILIDGYTTAEPPTDKGRGLALMSRQLLEYRGHLEFVPPTTEGVRGGVRFEIRLGVPGRPGPSPKGEAHAATAHRL